MQRGYVGFPFPTGPQPVASQSSVGIRAGASIVQGQAAVLNYRGQVVPAGSVDTAVVSAPGALAAAASQVTNASASSAHGYPNRAQQIVAPDGSACILSYVGGIAFVTKASFSGTVIGSLSVTGQFPNNPRMFFLSDGNVVIVGQNNINGGTINFSIVNLTTMQIVRAPVVVGAVQGSGAWVSCFDACVTSAGFAITWLASATFQVMLATYTNAGNAVLAPTSFRTLTTGGYGYFFKIALLSSGNLVVAGTTSPGATTPVCFSDVITQAGTVVTAIVQGSPTIQTYPVGVELCVMPGYFAVQTYGTGANPFVTRFYVYNNAGVLQGSLLSSTTGTNVVPCWHQGKIVTDGSYFYWVTYADSLANSVQVATVSPTAGAGAATIVNTPGARGAGGDFIAVDAFIDPAGYLIVLFEGTAYLQTWVLDIASAPNLRTVTAATSTPLAVGSLAASSIMPSPDSCCMVSLNAVSFIGLKYLPSSIIGWAASSAAAGTVAMVSQSYGSSTFPAIPGNFPKQFDHTRAPVACGVKGALFPSGLTVNAPLPALLRNIN